MLLEHVTKDEIFSRIDPSRPAPSRLARSDRRSRSPSRGGRGVWRHCCGDPSALACSLRRRPYNLRARIQVKSREACSRHGIPVRRLCPRHADQLWRFREALPSPCCASLHPSRSTRALVEPNVSVIRRRPSATRSVDRSFAERGIMKHWGEGGGGRGCSWVRVRGAMSSALGWCKHCCGIFTEPRRIAGIAEVQRIMKAGALICAESHDFFRARTIAICKYLSLRYSFRVELSSDGPQEVSIRPEGTKGIYV